MPENRQVALSPTRDDPEYWRTNSSDDHPQPADHNEAGFFITSPEEREQPLVSLIVATTCPWTPETPKVAKNRMEAERAQRRKVLARRLQFIASIRAA